MTVLIVVIFLVGYAAIALEHVIKINKTAPALITGVLCWTVYILSTAHQEVVADRLAESLGEFSGILFFLMGAMTIVEIIDLHDGFDIITNKITQTNKRKLLWLIAGITFFLSPVLDNLTTAIVMTAMVQKLIKDPKDRLYFVGMIVIAANAGGAWSPIGDVTTTMLWIGGQISALNIILKLFLPSLVCLLVPLVILSFRVKGKIDRTTDTASNVPFLSLTQQLVVLFSGMAILILVPVFKTLTHLPPYMGMLIGLGIMWIITEIIGGSKEEHNRYQLSPAHALRKIDSASILFFLGILISIAALQETGLLTNLASWMNEKLKNESIIAMSMGLLSSIVDNVPLVAATQGMYPLTHYPIDHNLWEFLAYTTGTGGSALIIGSAAGVAVMGTAKVDFFWYLKNITWLALAGYFAGALVYIGMQYM